MSVRITATEAARNLSDFLNRVRYRGESFLIVRNGEEVGMLGPITSGKPRTLRQLVELVKKMGPPDDEFVSDLEEIHRQQPALPRDPWPSS